MYYKLPTSSTLAREVQANRFLRILLFFLGDTFKGSSIAFTIHKPSIGTSFSPGFGLRIVNLSSVFNSTIAMSVSGLSILSHAFTILAHKLFKTKALMFCPRNKFGSNTNISTFTAEIIYPSKKICFNHPKLYSIGFGFFI
jgi:hypothetical protein